jgi:hypothetical protein
MSSFIKKLKNKNMNIFNYYYLFVESIKINVIALVYFLVFFNYLDIVIFSLFAIIVQFSYYAYRISEIKKFRKKSIIYYFHSINNVYWFNKELNPSISDKFLESMVNILSKNIRTNLKKYKTNNLYLRMNDISFALEMHYNFKDFFECLEVGDFHNFIRYPVIKNIFVIHNKMCVTNPAKIIELTGKTDLYELTQDDIALYEMTLI